jgi:VRR-NUC domain
VSEAELQSAVIELAQMLKWRVMHQRPGLTQSGHWRTATQGDGKGWPDLVLVRDRVLYRELKSARGTLSVEQQDWIKALKRAGADVDVWRPSDWYDGTIEAQLREEAPDPKA